ncbi:MAG: putative Leucine-rich repeat domain protein [Promethearchaeota archaeon]|nr:MAG: putative Leucine-rich repeat domain protein [Candidatus Lokiarchaeota archaeon]
MIDPLSLRNHCNEYGLNECVELLKEWINHSNNPVMRKTALQYLGEIDHGTQYNFLEGLFLSDENIDLALQSGYILRKYTHYEDSFINLLSYVLKRSESIQKKIFALEALNLIPNINTRIFLSEYLKNLIPATSPNHQGSQHTKNGNITEHFSGWYSRDIIDGTIDYLLYYYYSNCCGYKVGFKHQRINSLDCEAAELKSINEITEFHRLANLEKLSLKHNKISQISHLNHLKNLKFLDLSHNQIKKIENLDKLKNLNKLNLSHNCIHIIENLDSLSNLAVLSLAHNLIHQICNLHPLSELKKLDLSFNKIEKVCGFRNLNKLITLILSSNHIHTIEGLKPLQNLKELYLNNNEITHLKGIISLSKLVGLFLSHNKIQKVGFRERNVLNNMHYLSLTDNSLTSQSYKWYRKKIEKPF